MGNAATASKPTARQPIQTCTIQMSTAAATTNTHSAAAMGSRPTAPVTLYQAGPEPGGSRPLPGYGVYTRNWVNVLPPQMAQQAHPVVEHGIPFSNLHAPLNAHAVQVVLLHGPYLHMVSGMSVVVVNMGCMNK